MWRRVIPPEYTAFPPLVGDDAKLWLIDRFRLYRFAILAAMAASRDPKKFQYEGLYSFDESVRDVRAFIAMRARRPRSASSSV